MFKTVACSNNLPQFNKWKTHNQQKNDCIAYTSPEQNWTWRMQNKGIRVCCMSREPAASTVDKCSAKMSKIKNSQQCKSTYIYYI